MSNKFETLCSSVPDVFVSTGCGQFTGDYRQNANDTVVRDRSHDLDPRPHIEGTFSFFTHPLKQYDEKTTFWPLQHEIRIQTQGNEHLCPAVAS